MKENPTPPPKQPTPPVVPPPNTTINQLEPIPTEAPKPKNLPAIILSVLVITFLMGIVAYFIIPYLNSLRNSFFPPSLAKQLAPLDPIKVNFPNDEWIPNNIVSSYTPNQFVVKAYQIAPNSNWNKYKKMLFLIDNKGKIISNLPIDSDCQSPFEVVDVGFAMDYCGKEPQITYIYRVNNNKIEFIKKIPIRTYKQDFPEYYWSNPEESYTHNVSETTTVIYECTSICFPDGGCCGTNMSVETNLGSTTSKSYSMRDSITLKGEAVAIIFGRGDRSRSSDHNELYIFP